MFVTDDIRWYLFCYKKVAIQWMHQQNVPAGLQNVSRFRFFRFGSICMYCRYVWTRLGMPHYKAVRVEFDRRLLWARKKPTQIGEIGRSIKVVGNLRSALHMDILWI